MYKDNIFGPTCRKSPGAILMRQLWTGVIKHFVKSKSIKTCDGCPLTGNFVYYSKNYSFFDSQHALKVFLDMYTSFGYIIMADGAINAYYQAPPPDETLYIHVYYQYINWYRAKHGIEITSGFILPVNRDL